MTKLYKPFEDKFKEFGFEYDRAEDLYEAMRVIHKMIKPQASIKRKLSKLLF